MPVSSNHPSYDAANEKWRTVRDCVAGQTAVKKAKTRYLPDFVPKDEERYKAYVKRARFLNVTGRTKNSLVGAVFREPPQSDIPTQLDYLNENADGAGQSLEQIAKRIVDDELITGRYGILVDYPQVEEGLTQEQVTALDLKAYFAAYKAESIINWKTTVVNGKLVLSLVVLKEMASEMVDEFTDKEVAQFRVLSLVGGFYHVTIYDEHGKIKSGPFTPTNSAGARWDHIPFVIIGATDNKPDIDESPLYDLAETNISHYQVSADHMENLHIHGQITLGVSSSLSYEQFKEANPTGIMVGARAGHFLGEGGQFTTATAPESSSLSKALEDLKQDMIAIGGRIIQPKSGVQTAEAARIDASSEHSVLETIVGNVSEGIEQAIEYVAEFMGADAASVEFKLNTQFFDVQPDPQMMMALMGLRDAGDLGTTDVRNYLRDTGVIKADRTDEEIDLEADTLPSVDNGQLSN